MTKAGDAYQEIVGTVEQALNPGAKVTTGGWIEGPDGQRDMDVSVQGLVDGSPHFVLVECKDHKRPIGIVYIDCLDSKRRDLGANAAILYSASGFTDAALRKARRVGIGAVSALIAVDSRIRIAVHHTAVAKALSVDRWSLLVIEPDGVHSPAVEQFKPEEITYDGIPVQNWISEKSKQLLLEHEEAAEIETTCVFHRNEEFAIAGEPVSLRGIGFKLWCSRTWVAQQIKVDVSRGYYDHLRGLIVIPPGEHGFFGYIDNSKWEQTDQSCTEEELVEPQLHEITAGFQVTLTRQIPPIEGYGEPEIDELVSQCAITTG